MRKKDEEMQRLANDRDVYRAEVNTSRRNFTSSTDWKLVLEDKIQNLENEYLAKKKECELMRNKIR